MVQSVLSMQLRRVLDLAVRSSDPEVSDRASQLVDNLQLTGLRLAVVQPRKKEGS